MSEYLAEGRFHFCPITAVRELFPERDCVLCREAQEAAWQDEAETIEGLLLLSRKEHRKIHGMDREEQR